MNKRSTPYNIDYLKKENYKSFYLALLRVALSCWVIIKFLTNCHSLSSLYGNDCVQILQPNLITRLTGGDFTFLHTHYQFIIASFLLLNVLNIFGIGRRVTALLIFLMIDLIQKMNMPIVNGGDMLARLVFLYLIFADTYDYLVVFKKKKRSDSVKELSNLISNLAALSMMLHLCLIYFASGLAKILTSDWFHGTAIYYAFSIERFKATPLSNWIIQHQWLNHCINYAVLYFELLFPFLVWFKRTRTAWLIGGILMHLGIYILMMIYGMEVVFVLIYGLFISNQRWLNIRTSWINILNGNRRNHFNQANQSPK